MTPTLATRSTMLVCSASALVFASCASLTIAEQPPLDSAAPPSPAATIDGQPTTSALDATAASTTSAATSSTAAPVPMDPPMIELATSALGGFRYGSPATTLIDEFSAGLGVADIDTGWERVSPLQACLGTREIRSVAWGDVRVQLERTIPSDIVLGGWVVGEGFVIGSMLDTGTEGVTPTGVATTEGVRIGSSADDITSVEAIDYGDNVRVVPNASTVVIRLAGDRTITGFSAGRNDCLEPSISGIACDAPIPVRNLPDGTPTGDDSIEYLGVGVIWSVGAADPTSENSITQVYEPDPEVVELAVDAPISVQRGSLDIRVVPVGDPPFGISHFIVFDDQTDCVRAFVVGPGLGVAQLQAYASLLAEGFEPLR